MNRRHVVVFLFAAALATLPASAQLPPFVRSAFDAIETDTSKWAFTQTTVEGSTRTVETFDPSRPAERQWQLVSKNGHTPTAEELAAYTRERSEKERKRGKKNGDHRDLEKMIRPESLRLLRETAADAVYEFRLPADEGDDPKGRAMVDLMRGRLTIAKNGPWVQILELENEKPINPVLSVKIERMYTKITFRPPAPGLPPLLAEVRATVRGRILYMKKIDTDSVVTYSDYRAVTPAH